MLHSHHDDSRFAANWFHCFLVIAAVAGFWCFEYWALRRFCEVLEQRRMTRTGLGHDSSRRATAGNTSSTGEIISPRIGSSCCGVALGEGVGRTTSENLHKQRHLGEKFAVALFLGLYILPFLVLFHTIIHKSVTPTNQRAGKNTFSFIGL